jgi:sulfite dehydrogenase (quinone) subunit SoeA
VSNSDPITGQAGWYDVRVRIRRADDDEPQQTWPQFDGVPPLPGMAERTPFWRAWFAGKEE